MGTVYQFPPPQETRSKRSMPRRAQTEPNSAPKRTNTKEDKRRRFLMHIDRRMSEIARQLEYLENMAGPNYEYSPIEARKICDTLDKWVTAVKSEFGKTERPKFEEFKLGTQE
jgi:hypothetical protein